MVGEVSFKSRFCLIKVDLTFYRVSHVFHCLSHGLTEGSSFLTVLQILSGFSLKLTVQENKQRQQNSLSKNIVAWSSAYKKTLDSEIATRGCPELPKII